MGNCWSFQANPKFYVGAVAEAHNFYRAHHGSPPLELDKKMCVEASMQANLCAYYDKVYATSGGSGYSENIYVDDKNIKFHSPYEAVNSWYETMRFHDFRKWDDQSKEFCNMIWKSSRKLGVGVARSNNQGKKARRTYVVCQYHPPSVKAGDAFRVNVLRPLSPYFLPAGKIRDGVPGTYYKADGLPTLSFDGPLEGWGIDKGNITGSKWKIYLEKNSWALAGWNQYITLIGRRLEDTGQDGHRSSTEPPESIAPVDASAPAASRRRRDLLHSPGFMFIAEKDHNNPHQWQAYPTIGNPPKKDVTIKRRSISPEIRRNIVRKDQGGNMFEYQQYFHNN